MNSIDLSSQLNARQTNFIDSPLQSIDSLDRSAFAAILHGVQEQSTFENQARTDRQDAAYEAAAQFVGMAFIQPMLAQMRDSTFATERFGPTAADDQFGPMLDAQLSDRITSASNFPLVDMVAEKLLTNQGLIAS